MKDSKENEKPTPGQRLLKARKKILENLEKLGEMKKEASEKVSKSVTR